MSLAELHDWLTAEAWNIDTLADAGVSQLYHDVELLLAEHGHGDWSEDELKERLAPVAVYFAVTPGSQVSTVPTPGNVGRRAIRLMPGHPPRILTLGSLTPALASSLP